MVQVRSIEQLQREYFNGLAQSGSGIVIDRVEGSLAYTLSRASAVLATTLNNDLVDVERQLSVTSATGVYLNRVGSPYLIRDMGVKAVGTALAQSEGVTSIDIPYGTVLVDLQSGQRYITTTTPAAKAYTYVEVPLSIEAVEPGSAANQAAGSVLYAPALPEARFVVGVQRYNNEYRGDLATGSDYESDESYRRRILNYFSSGPIATNTHLANRLLDYSLVEKAFVRTTAPGFVEVWLDAGVVYTQGQIKEIFDYIKIYLGMGMIPLISQVTRRAVKLDLDVTPFSASLLDLNSLTSQLRTAIATHFDSLTIEQPLILSQLLNKIKPFVRDAKVISPTSDVYVTVGELIVLGSVKVTYPMN